MKIANYMLDQRLGVDHPIDVESIILVTLHGTKT